MTHTIQGENIQFKGKGQNEVQREKKNRKEELTKQNLAGGLRRQARPGAAKEGDEAEIASYRKAISNLDSVTGRIHFATVDTASNLEAKRGLSGRPAQGGSAPAARCAPHCALAGCGAQPCLWVARSRELYAHLQAIRRAAPHPACFGMPGGGPPACAAGPPPRFVC